MINRREHEVRCIFVFLGLMKYRETYNKIKATLTWWRVQPANQIKAHYVQQPVLSVLGSNDYGPDTKYTLDTEPFYGRTLTHTVRFIYLTIRPIWWLSSMFTKRTHIQFYLNPRLFVFDFFAGGTYKRVMSSHYTPLHISCLGPLDCSKSLRKRETGR